jgi:hypothetical protein
MPDNGRQAVTAASTNQQHSYDRLRQPATLPLPDQTQQRDSWTPAWLLSAAGGNTEPA